MTLSACAQIQRQHSQRYLKHKRTPRVVDGVESRENSSKTALEFIGFGRKNDGDDVDDGDGDSRGDDLSDNRRPPTHGGHNRNGHTDIDSDSIITGSTVASGGPNPINRPVGAQGIDIDQDHDGDGDDDDGGGTPPPLRTQPAVFVTLTSTHTETALLPTTDMSIASTLTPTFTLTPNNLPSSRPNSTGLPGTSIPTNSATTPATDLFNSSSDSRAQLSGGSIAAIIIGVIIFVGLILAFVVRMMSIRRDGTWTELDRGISRLRDEEETIEYRQKLVLNSILKAPPVRNLDTIEPALPLRAHRKPTVRFVTQTVQPSTMDEDSSSMPSTDNKFSMNNSFFPSINIPTDGTMRRPRAGILLNPLTPSMSRS